MKPHTSASASPVVRHGLARQISILTAVLAFLMGVVAVPGANAYAYNGCKWPSSELRIDWRATNGNFRSALGSARGIYSVNTDVNLYTVDVAGPSWVAANNNYGATGWEGQNNRYCPFGRTESMNTRLNSYYLPETDIGRLRVIWLHEMGHALGLQHVAEVARIMHTYPSTSYRNGITTLTSDDINGINSLY